MRHNPLLASERIKKVLNRDTVILYHSVLAISVFMDLILDPSIYTKTDTIGAVTATVIFMLFGAARYFNLFSINNRPIAYLLIYHLIFIPAFGLFAPEFSPFLFMWAVFMYTSHYFYGWWGFFTSYAGLFACLYMQSVRVYPPGSDIKVEIQFFVTQLLLIGAIALFFVNSESVNDKDRSLLVTSIDKAQLERQRLISLINSMADGVIATDDVGTIKLYNAASLSILDTNTSLQDKNVREVMSVIDQSAKVVDIIKEVQATNQQIISSDHLLVYPEGEKINIFLTVSPIKLSFRQNTERGFIITFRDITREKSLEEERNEFISVVSHELRTPIAITEANISNAKFIAEKGSDTASVRSSLEAAHKQTLFLASMINDLSTLSRAERGKLDLTVEKIDPREIIKSLEDDYRKETDTKGLELHTVINDSTPQELFSNRLYVREILQNFVTNSIKYTKQGSVTISVEPSRNGVLFKVTDTGIGISKSDQKRVFDKFFRSEDFRTRESSGTGLGLYITKKLMNLIKGEMTLESKLNQGSTFSIYVPNLESIKDAAPNATTEQIDASKK